MLTSISLLCRLKAALLLIVATSYIFFYLLIINRIFWGKAIPLVGHPTSLQDANLRTTTENLNLWNPTSLLQIQFSGSTVSVRLLNLKTLIVTRIRYQYQWRNYQCGLRVISKVGFGFSLQLIWWAGVSIKIKDCLTWQILFHRWLELHCYSFCWVSLTNISLMTIQKPSLKMETVWLPYLDPINYASLNEATPAIILRIIPYSTLL